MPTDLTGNIGLSEDGDGFRAIHTKLGFKSYGETEIDAINNMVRAIQDDRGQKVQSLIRCDECGDVFTKGDKVVTIKHGTAVSDSEDLTADSIDYHKSQTMCGDCLIHKIT